MASKRGLRKDPEFSHPPSTVLVYEGHEYRPRDGLRHPPDPRLPSEFGESPWGLTAHFSDSRHARRRALTVPQILPNRGSGPPGGESTERSSLPLNPHAALGKSGLEPRHVTGGPLRSESGGSPIEALSEAYGGRAGTDRDT